MDDTKTPEASEERLPEFGEVASSLPPDQQPAPADTAPGGPAGPTTSRPSATGGQAPPTTAAGAAPRTSQPELTLAQLDDPGPPTGGAPSYGDLRRITFVRAGDNLRVVVDMASPIAALKEREVMGIGVDIHRTSAQESDFQLFADGGAAGWHAYLHTPEGFVDYPGTFAVGGSRLLFEVPWTSIGGQRGFNASVFADWSSRDGLLPQSGNDRAPDRDQIPVNPSSSPA